MTKAELYKKKQNNFASIVIETPWNRTTLGDIYHKLEEMFGHDADDMGVEDYWPRSYNPETKIFELAVELDLQDVDWGDVEE